MIMMMWMIMMTVMVTVTVVVMLLVQTWTSVAWTMPDVLSCATTPTARSAADVTPATDWNTIDDHASVSRKRLVSQRH